MCTPLDQEKTFRRAIYSRGIKIPQQDFAQKVQGGLYVRCEGGGGVFVGHYGKYSCKGSLLHIVIY